MTGIARAVEALRATMSRGVAIPISPQIGLHASPLATIDLPNRAPLRYNHSRPERLRLWPALSRRPMAGFQVSTEANRISRCISVAMKSRAVLKRCLPSGICLRS
jgi:hypothetical protein